MKKLPVIIFLILLLASCKTRVIYQPIEVPITHVELKTDTLRDSVHVRDSVTIYTKGDTVFSEKTKTVVKYRDRIQKVEKTDTITVVKPVEVPVEVEKKLKWHERYSMRIGYAVVLGLFIYIGIKLWKKLRK